MCWRCDTREGREESARQFEEISRGMTLVSKEAWKGVSVHIDTYPRYGPGGRKYFRKDYSRTIAGPRDTTEILLEPGTVVVVTKMPDDIRRRFGLRARDPEEGKNNMLKSSFIGPRAKVVKKDNRVGLSFGKTGSKIVYPLEEGDRLCFVVVSIPRKKLNRD